MVHHAQEKKFLHFFRAVLQRAHQRRARRSGAVDPRAGAGAHSKKFARCLREAAQSVVRGRCGCVRNSRALRPGQVLEFPG
jgi:hypothetical protein